ncbi:MAG TPA: hypothetical protein GXZ30_00260 [Propionibacterium sp.]|jgi:hypothetical protein|nr:hypothetical protein [Propionibacterium sp.]
MTAIITHPDRPTLPELPATASPAVVADRLPCTFVPDLRPDPVRWGRAVDPHVAMTPLPLTAIPALESAPRTDQIHPGPADALRGHARALMVALVDAIQGRRPTAQLTRWVSDAVMADLTLRARLHQRDPRPLSVRSLRLQLVSPQVAEISARLQAGDRFGAAALRLEQRGDRWFCPVADFGPLPFSEVPGRRCGRSSP